MTKTITVSNLSRNFRIADKQLGLQASIKSFFSRQYTLKSVVTDLDFEIHSGEIVALLGPNGAGKTTVMKMLSGIMHPSAGEISVLGHTPHLREKRFLSKIALVMGQKAQLMWDLPAISSFRLISKYYEIPQSKFQEKITTLSKLLTVEHLLYRPMRKLSLGERMKLELMAALLHDPEILFLDEPTIGLDIIAQQSIRSFLKEYHLQRGGSIILTSHYMKDIESLCSRLILLIEGKKFFDGSLAKFSALASDAEKLTISFSEPIAKEDCFFDSYSPTWSQNRTSLSCPILAKDLQSFGKQVFDKYPIVHISTETIPIEMALQQILTNLEKNSAS